MKNLKKRSQIVRVLALACSFLECLLFAGIIFGWPSLDFILKKESIFESGCIFNSTVVNNGSQNHGNETNPENNQATEQPSSICNKQDEYLYLAFTISIIVYQILAFPLGWLFDKYGLRVTRFIASILFFAGILSLIFITPDISWILFPANICISLMCVLVIMSNIHVASLAGTYTAGFATLYSGSIDTSFGVMLIIKILYEQGIPLKYSLGGYSAIWCIVIINTLFFLPRYRVQPKVLQEDGEKKCEPRKLSINGQDSHNTSNGHVNAGFTVDSTHDDTEEKKPQINGQLHDNEQKNDTPVPQQQHSLKSTIVSSIFFLHLFWFTMIQLKLIMYIGSMNSWLNDIYQRDDEKVSYYTNMYGYIQLSAVILCPPIGYIIDHRKKVLDKVMPNADYLTRAKTAIPSLVLGSMSVFIVGVLNLIVADVNWTIYIIFILTVIYRILLYGTCHAFLHLAFPSEHFGTLFGLTYTIGGLVNCLQYPLFIFIRKGQQETMIMNVTLMVVTFLTLAHPINIWVQNKRKRKSMYTVQEEQEITENRFNQSQQRNGDCVGLEDKATEVDVRL